MSEYEEEYGVVVRKVTLDRDDYAPSDGHTCANGEPCRVCAALDM